MNRESVNQELQESEVRKSQAIVNAINTLYCPGVYSKNPDVLAMYSLMPGKDGKPRVQDVLMLYIDPQKKYDQNVATINGVKMQKTFGLPVDEYRPRELQQFAEGYISRMPEGRFKKEAIDMWYSNVESLKTLAERNPNSASLAMAVRELEGGRNMDIASEQIREQVSEG